MKAAYGDEDPIAALATPRTVSALALVRTTGKGCLELLARRFSPPEKLRAAEGNRVVHGWVLDAEGRRIDEVLVSVFRAPRSFTGEEGADISCHGGAATADALMRVLGGAGFREALPGEFSFRAFMNGKIDLTRAESAMELAGARSERGRERALSRLSGALEGEIRALGERLKLCLAEAELYLDYSEDDGIGPGEEGFPGRKAAAEILVRLRRLEESYRLERICRDGALTVIAGRPNAGKSSLFNLLLKEDRSLVAESPGTTRDWIEGWLSLEGIPLRLADTAGLRDSPDPVETLGIGRSRELLAQADLIIYLIDGTEGISPEDRAFFAGNEGGSPPPRSSPSGAFAAPPSGGEPPPATPPAAPPIIVLWNKGDLSPLPSPPPEILGGRIIEFSAKTGEGLGALYEAAAGALGGLWTTGGAALSSLGIGTERQKGLIRRAVAGLEEALALADAGEALDLIAGALRESLDALGEITGEVSSAEILEALFSRFCVGK